MTGPTVATRWTPPPEALEPLRDHRVVEALLQLPAELETALVGGVLRDQLLSLPVRDFDVTVAHSGESAAQRLGERLDARWFRLGESRFATFRLVTPDLQLDLLDRSPAGMEEDLRRRDLTIHSMAWELARDRFHDPCDGRRDLRDRVLRAPSSAVMKEDPLRVLRLARFAGELAFTVDPATREVARAAAGGLRDVASERIRIELRLLFQRPADAVAHLVRLAVLPGLWTGWREPHEVAPGDELIEPARDLAGRCEDIERAGFQPDRALATEALIRTYLPDGAVNDPLGRGLTTRREERVLQRLLELGAPPPTREAQRWWLHRAADGWPTAAAVFGCRDAGTWRRRLAELAAHAAEGAELFTPEPLLDGAEIAKLLDRSPGPALGRAVARLRRAQVEGRVRDRSEATRFLTEEQD